MSKKYRKKISEEEEEKYMCGTEVLLILKDDVGPWKAYRAKCGGIEMRDNHRTLEVWTVEPLDENEWYSRKKLTITRWKRTWGKHDPEPTIWAEEWIEGWW